MSELHALILFSNTCMTLCKCGPRGSHYVQHVVVQDHGDLCFDTKRNVELHCNSQYQWKMRMMNSRRQLYKAKQNEMLFINSLMSNHHASRSESGFPAVSCVSSRNFPAISNFNFDLKIAGLGLRRKCTFQMSRVFCTPQN